MSVSLVQKAPYIDPSSRLLSLLDQVEPQLKRAFLLMIEDIKGALVMTEIEGLLAQGRIHEALQMVEINSVRAYRFANQVGKVFVLSAENTAQKISGFVLVDFDQTNQRAVDIMRVNRLEFVREFMEEQKRATQAALRDSIQRGVNPRVQAREFRNSIGLTQRQERAVSNFRRLLSEDPREALTRRLRDGRFDRTVIRSLETERPLTQKHINTMVGRYRKRYLKFRSEQIARTESLASVHEGNEEMYKQAIDQGALEKETLIRTWIDADDKRVRDSHDPMGGQIRPFGEPFITGAGNRIMYPGDRNAPSREVIECRCTISTRIREARRAEA